MGVHSEAELQGIESTENESEAGVNEEQIEDLRVSAAAIASELTALGEKVTALLSSVESLSPAREAPPAPAEAVPAEPVAVDDGGEDTVVGDGGRLMTVTVAPLPELAMAAVAETTLRNLPGVRQVTAVKREGDWASFTLDVAPGTDLIAEMRSSMPVSFNVEESSPEAISFSLKWAWGTS